MSSIKTRSRRNRWLGILALLELSFGSWLKSSQAQITVPTDYKNYAIMGGSTIQFTSYSTVLGDVYSVGTTTLDFGYGIQRPNTMGSFYTRDSFNATGSLTDITGNVAANNNVALGGSTDVFGRIQYGGTYTPGSGTVTGPIVQINNSVPNLTLPSPRIFSAGTTNQNVTNLVLTPGSYGDITSSNLTLSTGEYFVRSLAGINRLNLNITNGPIRFYSTGNITIPSYLDVFVNGVEVLDYSNTIPADARLASAVLFQTNGNFSLAGGGISPFFGTIHAPTGTVNIETGNRYGTILAGGAVVAEGYQYKQAFNFNNEALAVLSGTPRSVIIGGSATINTQLSNFAAVGGGTLNYSVTPTNTTSGIGVANVTHTGTLTPGASTALTFNVTGTVVGTQTLTIGANTPGAFDASSSTPITVTVLDRSAPAFTTNTAARAMLGSTAYGTASLRNTSGTNRAGLQVTNPGGLLDVATNSIITNGGSVTVRGALNTSVVGPTTSSFTVQTSDDQSIPGAQANPTLNVVVAGTILDNRRVTSTTMNDLGFVRQGIALPAGITTTLSTTGADDQFTRITVNNPVAADGNGINMTGTTTFRFGQDGMSQSRTFSGTPSTLGLRTGSLTLTTVGETGVTGVQNLQNVSVPYSVKVYSGRATWNGSVADVWGTHTNWTDNQSNAGGGSPGVTTATGDTATFGNVIGNQPANIALNGANPALANLTFDNNLGGSYNITGGTGGALTINTPTTTQAITVTNGSHRISTPVTLTTSNIIAVNNASSTLTIDGAVTATSGITKNGAGTLVFTAVNNNTGPITINAGTVRGSLATLNNTITNNGSLILDQPTNVTFTGSITGTGAITKTGNGRFTLNNIDQINANAPLTISGGAFQASLGLPRSGVPITLQGNGTLESAFTVTRAISGTGSVVALDDLTLGRSSQPAQFNLGGAPGVGGTLQIGSYAVVIMSSDSVILGTSTAIANQGSLTTLNGARLGNPTSVDSTKVLTATGNATINGDFVNNGQVNGPSTSGQWLTFTQDVTGAGSTTGNVNYAGSYSPGNSPAVVSVENIAFDPTSQLTMEFAGSGSGQFDQLLVSGMATIDGTLNLSMLNGYQFQTGQVYPLITGNYSGTFDQVTGLSGDWQVAYQPNGIVVIPEPSTFIVAGLGIMLFGLGIRKRRCL
jgi:autotransporter-associated beta strand protein